MKRVATASITVACETTKFVATTAFIFTVAVTGARLLFPF
jgi:hypothetical protein